MNTDPRDQSSFPMLKRIQAGIQQIQAGIQQIQAGIQQIQAGIQLIQGIQAGIQRIKLAGPSTPPANYSNTSLGFPDPAQGSVVTSHAQANTGWYTAIHAGIQLIQGIQAGIQQ